LLPAPEDYRFDGDVPYQRYGHTAVAYEEHAYIWGGRNDSDGACNILYKYNTGECFVVIFICYKYIHVSNTDRLSDKYKQN